jgi:hypothetical protein
MPKKFAQCQKIRPMPKNRPNVEISFNLVTLPLRAGLCQNRPNCIKFTANFCCTGICILWSLKKIYMKNTTLTKVKTFFENKSFPLDGDCCVKYLCVTTFKLRRDLSCDAPSTHCDLSSRQ